MQRIIELSRKRKPIIPPPPHHVMNERFQKIQKSFNRLTGYSVPSASIAQPLQKVQHDIEEKSKLPSHAPAFKEPELRSLRKFQQKIVPLSKTEKNVISNDFDIYKVGRLIEEDMIGGPRRMEKALQKPAIDEAIGDAILDESKLPAGLRRIFDEVGLSSSEMVKGTKVQKILQRAHERQSHMSMDKRDLTDEEKQEITRLMQQEDAEVFIKKNMKQFRQFEKKIEEKTKQLMDPSISEEKKEQLSSEISEIEKEGEALAKKMIQDPKKLFNPNRNLGKIGRAVQKVIKEKKQPLKELRGIKSQIEKSAPARQKLATAVSNQPPPREKRRYVKSGKYTRKSGWGVPFPEISTSPTRVSLAPTIDPTMATSPKTTPRRKSPKEPESMTTYYTIDDPYESDAEMRSTHKSSSLKTPSKQKDRSPSLQTGMALASELSAKKQSPGHKKTTQLEFSSSEDEKPKKIIPPIVARKTPSFPLKQTEPASSRATSYSPEYPPNMGEVIVDLEEMNKENPLEHEVVNEDIYDVIISTREYFRNPANKKPLPESVVKKLTKIVKDNDSLYQFLQQPTGRTKNLLLVVVNNILQDRNSKLPTRARGFSQATMKTTASFASEISKRYVMRYFEELHSQDMTPDFPPKEKLKRNVYSVLGQHMIHKFGGYDMKRKTYPFALPTKDPDPKEDDLPPLDDTGEQPTGPSQDIDLDTVD